MSLEVLPLLFSGIDCVKLLIRLAEFSIETNCFSLKRFVMTDSICLMIIGLIELSLSS